MLICGLKIPLLSTIINVKSISMNAVIIIKIVNILELNTIFGSAEPLRLIIVQVGRGLQITIRSVFIQLAWDLIVIIVGPVILDNNIRALRFLMSMHKVIKI